MCTPSPLSPASWPLPCHAGLLHLCQSLKVPRSPSLPGRFLIFPLNCYCKGHAPRSEMNHLVIISGAPSGLPTPGPRRLSRLWGVCARSAVRGSVAPPCGRAAGRWRPSWAWAISALGLPVSGGEVSERGHRSTLRAEPRVGRVITCFLVEYQGTDSEWTKHPRELLSPLFPLAKEGSRVQVRLLRV